MKIAEIVGSVADQEAEAAPLSSFMQRIANAFTPSGRVKQPLDFQGSDPATTTAVPYSYLPASEEGTSTVPSADVHQDADTIAPTIAQPRPQFWSPSTA